MAIMPKFSEQMRCSCSGSVFAKSEIVVTNPGKINETGETYLKCLVCLRDLIYDRVNSCLKGVTREDGKKLLIQFERDSRESDKPETKKLEALAETILSTQGSDPKELSPEDIDEGSFGD